VYGIPTLRVLGSIPQNICFLEVTGIESETRLQNIDSMDFSGKILQNKELSPHFWRSVSDGGASQFSGSISQNICFLIVTDIASEVSLQNIDSRHVTGKILQNKDLPPGFLPFTRKG
jgi:hypothetical protein